MNIQERLDNLDTKQLFKEYDKKFIRSQGSIMAWESLDYGIVGELTRWEGSMQDVYAYSHDQVKAAVYLADDAETWQWYRVSLKGWSTKIKLYRLYRYLTRAANAWHDDRISLEQFTIEKIRVANYLGALVRGGQIDKDGFILK